MNKCHTFVDENWCYFDYLTYRYIINKEYFKEYKELG